MRLPNQSFPERRPAEVSAVPYSPQGVKPLGGGGGDGPPPGCYPNGTQCRGFLQSMVYCCPGGATWSRSEGWCVGYWDALPCR